MNIAVLDELGLWHASWQRGEFDCDPDGPGLLSSCQQLLDMMLARGLDQLWIHQSALAQLGLPSADEFAADLRLRNTFRERQRRLGIVHPFLAPIADMHLAYRMYEPAGRLRSWMRFAVPESSASLILAIPAYDARAPWRWAPDGRELLRALLDFQIALGGFSWWYGPGATSNRMLRRLHSRSSVALDLSASMTPAQFPAPARDTRLVPQLSWIRPLTPDEANKKYVHAYDKNGMFLAAASSLKLGFGVPEHAGAIAFDKRLPGYWLANVTFPAPVVLSPLLPPIVDPPLPPGVQTVLRWYTTAQLVLAREAGGLTSIEDSYIWRESHEPLEPWYQRLRDARLQLHEASAGRANTSAPALALAAVKQVYAQGIGWLDGAWLRESQEGVALYRPDWRHQLIATANANLWRNAAKVLRTDGVAPFAIATDCLYYVSDEPDAVQAAPSALRLGAGLGQYKSKATVPLADVLPILAELETGRRPITVLTTFLRALGGYLPADDPADADDVEAEASV